MDPLISVVWESNLVILVILPEPRRNFRGGRGLDLLMVSVGVIGLCYDLGSCSVCVLNVKSEP